MQHYAPHPPAQAGRRMHPLRRGDWTPILWETRLWTTHVRLGGSLVLGTTFPFMFSILAIKLGRCLALYEGGFREIRFGLLDSFIDERTPVD